MECFTNPLNQTISNLLEQHKEYKTYYEKYISLQNDHTAEAIRLANIEKEKNDLIKQLDETDRDNKTYYKKYINIQDKYTTQAKQLAHMEKEKSDLFKQLQKADRDNTTYYEKYIIVQDNYTTQARLLAQIEKAKNDLFKQLGETDKDWNTCKQKLNAYNKYLKFIGSIDERIQKMDTCYSYLQTYCINLGKNDYEGAKRFLGYLGCKDALPATYYDKIQASYGILLSDVMMVKKNLTNLIVTGNFTVMQEIYEQKKNLPVDDCHFICSLDVENLDTQFNTTYWKTFQDGWQMFRKYFLN